MSRDLKPNLVIRIAHCLIQLDRADPFDPRRAATDALIEAAPADDDDTWWVRERKKFQLERWAKTIIERREAEEREKQQARPRPQLDDLDWHQTGSWSVVLFVSACRAYRVSGVPVCVGALHRSVECRLLSAGRHIFYPIAASAKSDEVLEALVEAAATTVQSLSCRGMDSPNATPACITDVACLAHCAALTFLDLSYNSRLRDCSSLAHCTALTQLDLDGCISIKDVSALATCSKLKTLNAMFCGIVDLSPLTWSPSLETLNLFGCDAIHDVSALGFSNTLRSLKLYQCIQITDVSPLALCPALQTLDLGACTAITDVAPLAGCVSLSSLNLSDCAAVTDVSRFMQCNRLHTLRLDRCIQITDISALARCSVLEVLSLCGCTAIFDVSFLANAPLLRHLDLRDCAVREVNMLAQSASLRTLDMTRVDVDMSALKGIEVIRQHEDEDNESCTDDTTEAEDCTQDTANHITLLGRSAPFPPLRRSASFRTRYK